MKIFRILVSVNTQRDELWGKKTPNGLAQMETHCVQQILALCRTVTKSSNGGQAWCHSAHQLSSVSWLEKTSSPSFYPNIFSKMLKKLLWAIATVNVKAQAVFMLSIRKHLWQNQDILLCDPMPDLHSFPPWRWVTQESNLPPPGVVDGH